MMVIFTISLLACTNQNSKPAKDNDLGMERALNTESGWHIRKTTEFEKTILYVHRNDWEEDPINCITFRVFDSSEEAAEFFYKIENGSGERFLEKGDNYFKVMDYGGDAIFCYYLDENYVYDTAESIDATDVESEQILTPEYYPRDNKPHIDYLLKNTDKAKKLIKSILKDKAQEYF